VASPAYLRSIPMGYLSRLLNNTRKTVTDPGSYKPAEMARSRAHSTSDFVVRIAKSCETASQQVVYWYPRFRKDDRTWLSACALRLARQWRARQVHFLWSPFCYNVFVKR